MMDSGRQIQKKKNLRKLINPKDTHKDFVLLGLDDETSAAAQQAGKDPSDITDTFKMKLWTRIQVGIGYKWWVFRDGVFHKELEPGPHILWNTNLLGKWQVLRINLQTISLTLVVDGRLKGPSLPEGTAGDANAELALTGRAVYNVWCEIDDRKQAIERFLQHSEPINALYDIMNHTVNSIRPNYTYDKYGLWANKLAQELKKLLSEGPTTTELIGLKVTNVWHNLDETNPLHDQQSVEMFERAQEHLRQAQEAKLQSKINEEKTHSYVSQAGRLGLSAGLLALSGMDNPDIGKEWIKNQAEMEVERMKTQAEIEVARINAGLHPGLPTVPNTRINPADPSYLQPYQTQIAQSSENVFTEVTDSRPPIEKPNKQQPSDDQRDDSASAFEKLSDERKAKEIKKLKGGGFECDSEIDIDEWTLEVHPSSHSNFRIVFRCPIDYPSVPPTVKIRTPTGWKKMNPEWRSSFWLLYIAMEVCENHGYSY